MRSCLVPGKHLTGDEPHGIICPEGCCTRDMKRTERNAEESHACCRHGDKPSGPPSRRFIVWHVVVGFLSLVWFVLRVAPKPSRIRYPCQRVAAPLASGFLLYLCGMLSSILAYKKYQLLIRRMSRRAAIGSICLAGVAMGAYFGVRVASVLGISDPVHEHSPIGTGSPTVVSVYDENVSNWGGQSAYWNYVNQGVVDTMMARGIKALTGTASTDEAWENLLPGYASGKTIAIKVNFNNNDALNFNSVPQPIVALINQLKQFGFNESEIFVYDTSRRIGSADTNSIQYFFRNTIETAFPAVTIIDNTTSNRWSTNQFTTYSTIDGYVSTPYAKILDDADYLINVPIMRAHPISGVTFGLKNHYGSIQQIVFGGGVVPLHDGIRQTHSGYSEAGVPLVELNSLDAIDDKTVLVVGDGIYSNSWNNTSPPNRNPEVVFMSRDPVALDSVMFDYFHTIRSRQVWHQNYLHLAAEAGLGVHDHYPYSQLNYIELTEDTDVFTLTVDIVGSGSVSRNRAPPYYLDDAVTLTAVPSSGWTFAGWSGDLTSSASPDTVTMGGPKSVTATFTQDEYELTVNIVGSGTVSQDLLPPYHLNDVVTLTPLPSPGWSFAGWSGDVTGTDNHTIIMDGPKNVTATFTPQPTISLNPTSLSNLCTEGTDAPGQFLNVWNSGGGTLVYAVSDDAAWLSCSPSDGTSTGEDDTINVTYNTSGLAAGDYSATITISAPGAGNDPQLIPVSLEVVSPGEIRVVPTSIDYETVDVGGHKDETVRIHNDGSWDLSVTGLDGLPSNGFELVGPPSTPFSVAAQSYQDVTIRFAPTSGGAKTATLSIANSDADENPTGVLLAGVGGAPVADFSASATSGTRPLDIDFTDLSTGTIDSWSWDFGDGGTSTAQNPSHTYNSTGHFTASLTVTGPAGSDTETKTDYISISNAQEIIVDNGDLGTSSTGSWSTSSGPNPYGANSLWARNGATYTWHADLPGTGVYEVHLWWTEWASRSTSAPVTIEYSGGSDVIVVDQRINGGTWNHVGTYTFDGAAGATVTLTAEGSYPTSYCADAVRFVHVLGANLPPTAVIDSIEPNPAGLGDPVTFIGQGTDIDGTIVGYEWREGDEVLSASASFAKSDFSEGVHTILFQVQDEDLEWSPYVSQTLIVGAFETDIIVDNGESGTSSTGSWSPSSAPDPYGANSLWSRNGATYTWHADLAVTGVYEVYMWWTEWSSRSTAAPVTIEYGGASDVVPVNQRQNGGTWNLLGTYVFDAAAGATVTITAEGSYPASYCADAVRFVYLSGKNVPPTATTDSVGPNPSPLAEPVTFVGYGTDPLDGDSDDDGLVDGDEVNVYFTDRLEGDTDGDGVSDGAEVATGTDPTDETDYLAAVTYDGDALLSTEGSPIVDANLVAAIWDNDGYVLSLDNEEVTFTLTAEGIGPLAVVAPTQAGAASAVQALEPALYRVEVTVASAPAVATGFLVVYNPEGGFATGGGWIGPEDDGLNTYPNVRANFGFNAKYRQDLPTGHIEFRYSDGYIDLMSTSIEQLVITGSNLAQFKGWARVNGEEGNWFFAKAVDNGEANTGVDTFEIKIWAPGVDPDADVPTERASGVLQGGNIRVHIK